MDNELEVCIPAAKCFSEYFKTGGDTLINGIQYTIIANQYNPRHSFLREENGLVYCKYPFHPLMDTTEFILYNFSYSEGDSIKLPMAGNPIQYYDCKVYPMDSLLIGSEFHKKLNIHCEGWASFSFVEGLGSMQGLFYNETPWVDYWGTLTCFSRNDTVFQLNNTGTNRSGNCWETLNIKENKKNSFEIFPNPTHDKCTIQLENYLKSIVYNLAGKKITESQEPVVDLGSYDDGIYIIIVYDKEGNKFFRKIARL